MALVLAGIDEAGYGPLLGPLTVALCGVRVKDWAAGDPAPDLWARLDAVVCRAGADARGRIHIDDSKSLKLPNPTPGKPGGRHPLLHLERGVLSFAAQLGELPASDDALFRALDVDLGDAAWALGPSAVLPVAWERSQLAIAANRLGQALAPAGIEVVRLSCESVGVEALNETVRRTGTKGEATIGAIGGHLRSLLASLGAWGASDDHVRIVCDRLGGRTTYADILERELGRPVRIIEETERSSRYSLSLDRPGIDDDGRGIGIVFMPESERQHLVVALASMIAKYVRELAMARFNRYWCARVPDLKPTAGYRLDAARWLRDAAGSISGDERRELIRLA